MFESLHTLTVRTSVYADSHLYLLFRLTYLEELKDIFRQVDFLFVCF